jgi:Protein of unknown function (DUF2946)
MPRSRLFHRIASWTAFVAVLMAALLPVVSHALGSRGDAVGVEVCTSEGSRWVQGSGAPGEPLAPLGAHGPDHCGYCTLHTDEPALPAASRAAGSVIAALRAAPAAFPRAARSTDAWASAQPRAPPAVC